jgi:hypothetical protein
MDDYGVQYLGPAEPHIPGECCKQSGNAYRTRYKYSGSVDVHDLHQGACAVKFYNIECDTM